MAYRGRPQVRCSSHARNLPSLGGPLVREKKIYRALHIEASAKSLLATPALIRHAFTSASAFTADFASLLTASARSRVQQLEQSEVQEDPHNLSPAALVASHALAAYTAERHRRRAGASVDLAAVATSSEGPPAKHNSCLAERNCKRVVPEVFVADAFAFLPASSATVPTQVCPSATSAGASTAGFQGPGTGLSSTWREWAAAEPPPLHPQRTAAAADTLASAPEAQTGVGSAQAQLTGSSASVTSCASTGTGGGLGAARGFDLRFTRHITQVANSCAPAASRLESVSWLLFHSRRLQAALVPHPQLPGSWLGAEQLRLLDQLYLIGEVIAALGACGDVGGTLPGSGAGAGGLSSNGQRALASLDYVRLLERFLEQHGTVLADTFLAALEEEELQVRGIHISALLETRCLVHRLVFDRLMANVGLEGGGAAAATAHSPVTAITNTSINRTQVVSSPVAAADAAAGNNSSSCAQAAVPPSGASLLSGAWAVLLALLGMMGAALRCALAVAIALKDLACNLLLLRAAGAASRAVTALITRTDPSTQAAAVQLPQPEPALAAAPLPLPSMPLQPGWAVRQAAAQPSWQAVGGRVQAGRADGDWGWG